MSDNRKPDKDGFIQLFKFGPPGEILETHYGKITYLEWLELESSRIESAPGRVSRINWSGLRVGLAVDNIGIDPAQFDLRS